MEKCSLKKGNKGTVFVNKNTKSHIKKNYQITTLNRKITNYSQKS